MKNIKLLSAVGCLLFTLTSYSQIRLPKLVSDGVILQRDARVKVWGWASPDESIGLQLENSVYRTTAGPEGSWEILMDPMPAGGPFEMVLTGKNEVRVSDIMFGDVWLCSGQSNMELPMERVRDEYPEEIAGVNYPNIRQFLVPDSYNFREEQDDLPAGTWKPATRENILDFSAVAYFFAKEVYDNYGVPIGLINAALGGSPVEAWMSEELLKEYPEPFAELQKFKSDSLIKAIETQDRERINAWYGEMEQQDRGSKANWSSTGVADEGWNEMEIPGYWADTSLGDVNGVVWFRRTVKLPADMANKQGSLWLGRLVDRDSVFVNGTFVGSTGYQYPPRKYEVDGDVLREGENVIAVKLINESGRGGFVPDKPYFLAVGGDTIDLRGTWKYKLGAAMEPLGSQTFVRWKPAGLYNAMIAPLQDFRIKGALWYQGESNTFNPEAYSKRFPAMIQDWREKWEQESFPFLLVQLANFMEVRSEPVESQWAELRQAQAEALKLPNTGMAVAIDLGEWNDIHPLNKKEVGERLALQARKIAYGENELPAGGPAPVEASFEQDKVVISFKNATGDLTVRNGDAPQHFAISGDGDTFYWAEARIEGDRVVVWNEQVKQPVAVRYAWADNPESANLINKEGLPVPPFELEKE